MHSILNVQVLFLYSKKNQSENYQLNIVVWLDKFKSMSTDITLTTMVYSNVLWLKNLDSLNHHFNSNYKFHYYIYIIALLS
jgi:hypothetical protein